MEVCEFSCESLWITIFFPDMTDGKGRADSSGAAEVATHEGAESHTSVA